MKEIELVETTQSAHKDYEPVELNNGISVTSSRDVRNDTYTVEGNVQKGGKDIGRYVFDEVNGRMFVNVNADDLSRNDKREVIETIASIMLQLVPAEVAEASEEAAAE